MWTSHECLLNVFQAPNILLGLTTELFGKVCWEFFAIVHFLCSCLICTSLSPSNCIIGFIAPTCFSWKTQHLQGATNVQDRYSMLRRPSITNDKMFLHISVVHKYVVLLKSYWNYNTNEILKLHKVMNYILYIFHFICVVQQVHFILNVCGALKMAVVFSRNM